MRTHMEQKSDSRMSSAWRQAIIYWGGIIVYAAILNFLRMQCYLWFLSLGFHAATWLGWDMNEPWNEICVSKWLRKPYTFTMKSYELNRIQSYPVISRWKMLKIFWVWKLHISFFKRTMFGENVEKACQHLLEFSEVSSGYGKVLIITWWNFRKLQ